ncbi:MAG: beta-eliminating lyase-related protein [Candidatus Xenobia bacterium]
MADGCLMSGKKDALANTGGFLALRNGILADRIRQQVVITEGFPTYGGLSGRDLDALAVGLREGLSDDYLTYRIQSVRWLAEALESHGVPVVRPCGGHAVFVDAGTLLPHIPRSQYPGIALAAALYLEGGVRSVEVGSLMFDGAPHELVRLTIPHRVYTQGHLQHVARTFEQVVSPRHCVGGYRLVQAPRLLRHFTAHLEPVPDGAPPCGGCLHHPVAHAVGPSREREGRARG